MNSSGIGTEADLMPGMERQAKEMGIPVDLARVFLLGRGPQSAGADSDATCVNRPEKEFARNQTEDLRRLRRCYDFFRADIPNEAERWRWALAAYAGGVGPIEKALKKAKRELAGFNSWRNWNVARIFLENCDIIQISRYVSSVWEKYLHALKEGGLRYSERSLPEIDFHVAKLGTF
jgi:hypothetical protein